MKSVITPRPYNIQAGASTGVRVVCQTLHRWPTRMLAKSSSVSVGFRFFLVLKRVITNSCVPLPNLGRGVRGCQFIHSTSTARTLPIEIEAFFLFFFGFEKCHHTLSDCRGWGLGGGIGKCSNSCIRPSLHVRRFSSKQTFGFYLFFGFFFLVLKSVITPRPHRTEAGCLCAPGSRDKHCIICPSKDSRNLHNAFVSVCFLVLKKG